jgi:TetR/AcrR family transcriptional repressor of nem operon
MARPREFNREEVFRKALYLFWNKGYYATSLDDLLKATGLSKSSFYPAFKSKRELFLLAFNFYRSQWRDRLKSTVSFERSGRQSIEEFFRGFVLPGSEKEYSFGCMIVNQTIEMFPHDEEVRKLIESDFHFMEVKLTEIIKRGQADGSIKRVKDPQQMARFLMTVYHGSQMMIRTGKDKSWFRDILIMIHSNFD